jgi:hypothetical protein
MLKYYKWPVTITLLALATPYFAQADTIFYKNKGGTVAKVTEAEFNDCDAEKVVCREPGKDGVKQLAIKRKILAAVLSGSLVNEPKKALEALLHTDGACTYSDKDDLK